MTRRAALLLVSLPFVPGLTAAGKVLPLLASATPDQSLHAGGAAFTLNLAQTFSTAAVDDQVVRFTAQFPNGTKTIDMAMFSSRTPATRANFLKYVTDGDYVNSFIHRSVPGFIIQGGGYAVSGGSIYAVPTDPAVVNEFGVSNTYGTVAMAKLGTDPNSATSQWFINLGDNSANLDAQNGGFTVFARVTKSTITNAALFGDPNSFPVYNAGAPFSALPVNKSTYAGGTILLSDLIVFQQVALATMTAGDAGDGTTLTYSIAGNTNPGAATVTLTNGVLTVTPPANAAGSTVITLRASDSVGNTVDDSVVVTVTDSYANWRSQQFTAAEQAQDAVSGPEADPDKDGVSNLELFVLGLPRGPVSANPIAVTDVLNASNAHQPTFSFPIRHSMEGVSYTLEKSTDLVTWTSVPVTTVSRVAGTSVDSLTIRPTDAVAAFPAYYRVRFTLQ